MAIFVREAVQVGGGGKETNKVAGWAINNTSMWFVPIIDPSMSVASAG